MNRTLLSLPYLWLLLFVNVPVVDVQAQAQSGRVYEFLSLPATARITATGGYAFPDLNHDLGMALVFPALLSSEMSHHLHLNFVDYFGDINYGTVAFARNFEKFGPVSGSLQYISYGRFTGADDTGELQGEFSSGEYSFMLGWGKQLGERLFMGGNLKSIHSFYEAYSSWGVAADVAFTYLDSERLLAAGLVARNMGVQIKKFREGNREELPFDLVFGASKKLANAPIRITFVAHNLHRYDLSYVSSLPRITAPILETERSETLGERLSDIGDKLLRHAIFGLEFVPGKNFSFRAGYNYRRRQEMKVNTRLSTVGFSWGFGMKVSRFQINYGRSNYHLAGAPNHLSLSTSLNDLFSRPEQLPQE